MTDRIISPIELGPIPAPVPDLSDLSPLQTRYMRINGLKDPEQIRGVSQETLEYLLGIDRTDIETTTTVDDTQGEQ